MALVLIPVVAAVGFMFLSNVENPSMAGSMATFAFAMLAAGVFGGLFRMARRWENEAP